MNRSARATGPVPSTGARRGRAAGVLVAVLAALVLATSCSTIRILIDLDSDLKDAGYSDVHVHTNETNGYSVVRIEASGGPKPERAAEVVWKQFPRRVDQVVVTTNSQQQSFTRSEMRQRFGPRPSGYDDKSIDSDLRSGVITALLIAGGVVVVVGGLILFIVLKVSSNKRKRRIAAGGYPNPPRWNQPPGAPQWGQAPQPWGQQQPQWGQQPAPPPPGQWGQQPQPPPGQWGQPPSPTPPATDRPSDAASYPPPPPPPD